jgi:hypothetical protein
VEDPIQAIMTDTVTDKLLTLQQLSAILVYLKRIKMANSIPQNHAHAYRYASRILRQLLASINHDANANTTLVLP